MSYVARIGYVAIKWRLYGVSPTVFVPLANLPKEAKHLVFLMVDHYEPSFHQANAVGEVETWLATFRAISDGHTDSKGKNFQYTWFYRYDDHNKKVLRLLNKASFDGYGEVELHWHHPTMDNESFARELAAALRFLQGYGIALSSEGTPRSQFGFIHGNWALDNSQPLCGVNLELAILREQGCYGDFTFSTIATVSQPSQINSIYYAVDDPKDKSYDRGNDVEVGKMPPNDGFMIFEGPLVSRYFSPFRLRSYEIEYGAVESYAIPSKDRVESWMKANIHVKGRPEWVFVKVYSHGMQSQEAILDTHLDDMLTDIEQVSRDLGLELHYVTSREAYNIVKAAEAGKSGSPDDYRDYVLPPPCNRYFYTERPGTILSCAPGAVEFKPFEGITPQ